MGAYEEARSGLVPLENLLARLKYGPWTDNDMAQARMYLDWSQDEIPLLKSLMTEREAANIEERLERIRKTAKKHLLVMRRAKKGSSR